MRKTAWKILIFLFTLLACLLTFIACGDAPVEKEDHLHTFGEWEITKNATCREPGEKTRYCSCGEQQIGTIALLEHDIVKDAAKAPTCTEDGMTEGAHCSICNEVLSAQMSIAAFGHTEVVDAATAPSCTASGWTEGSHCSTCQKSLRAQQRIDILPHSPEVGLCNTCGARHGWTKQEVEDIIKITEVSVDKINSVGGVDLYIKWQNTSNKTIKYISFGISAFNAVDDRVKCETRNYYYVNAQITGPIRPGLSNSNFWECLYYNNTVRYFKINSVEIDYTDGSSIKIGGDYLPSGPTYEYNEELAGYEIIGFIPFGSSDIDYIIPDVYEGKPVVKIGRHALKKLLFPKIIVPDSVKLIDDYAFWNCEHLENIVIGNSVTEISGSAFDDCFAIKEITLGKSITSFSFSLGFNRTKSSLEHVVFADGLTTIPNYAFTDCTGLKSIVLPDSVTSIGDRAFSGCTNLKHITLSKNLTSIGAHAFYDCTGITEITIPNSVISIGDDAFSGCTGLTKIPIPESIISISDGIFSGCTRLTEITIPDNVTSIGDGAFSGCTGLTEITIPGNITSIGDWAFSSCTGLTEITMSDNVTSIGEYAFYGCTGLRRVSLGKNLTTIGQHAFYECTELTEITIPGNVSFVGQYAFSNCDNLTKITLFSICPEVDSYTFGYNGYIGKVVYYAGSKQEWEKSDYRKSLGGATIYYDFLPNCELAMLSHIYIGKVSVWPNCTTEGTKTFTCQRCSDSYTETLPKEDVHEMDPESLVYEQKYSCTQDEIIHFTCLRCKTPITHVMPTMGHSPDENWKCEFCGVDCPIKLDMTDTYISQAQQVKYLSQEMIWHQDKNDRFVLVFSFLDKNKKEIVAPALVDITIVNDDGKTVFAATRAIYPFDFTNWTYSDGTVREQATIYINDTSLTPGTVASGTLYYKIYTPDILSFPQFSLKIDGNLPLA